MTVTRPYVDVEALRRTMQAGAVALQRFADGLRPVVLNLNEEIDSIRYRMLVTNLLRTRTYEEATAIVNLRKARSIRNGRRRHGMVKHRRDELRAARKQADATYPK